MHPVVKAVFVFLVIVSCLQGIKAQNETPNQVSIGIRDSLYSKILHETREILVHVPPSSNGLKRYPVLYLLDGEFHFEAVIGIMKYEIMLGLIPEMVVVAIPNTNRLRDLSALSFGKGDNASGKGGNFTQFLENELIPYIDQHYPTHSYRTIFGHSLGGLFVTNALMNHSHLFNNYLAIDPSLSWANGVLMEEARKTLKNQELKDRSVYLAVANTLRDEMSIEQAKKDTTTHTLHFRSILEFSKLAAANKTLKTQSKYYPDESHGTVPIVAAHDAFRYFFYWYPFKERDEFYNPASMLTGEEMLGLIESHYEKTSKILGNSPIPPETEINGIAYLFLERKEYDRAFHFFNYNLINYPQSANAYDSMGDYYRSLSDIENAIKFYSKSLELGGVMGTKERLEEMEKLLKE